MDQVAPSIKLYDELVRRANVEWKFLQQCMAKYFSVEELQFIMDPWKGQDCARGTWTDSIMKRMETLYRRVINNIDEDDGK